MTDATSTQKNCDAHRCCPPLCGPSHLTDGTASPDRRGRWVYPSCDASARVAPLSRTEGNCG